MSPSQRGPLTAQCAFEPRGTLGAYGSSFEAVVFLVLVEAAASSNGGLLVSSPGIVCSAGNVKSQQLCIRTKSWMILVSFPSCAFITLALSF